MGLCEIIVPVTSLLLGYGLSKTFEREKRSQHTRKIPLPIKKLERIGLQVPINQNNEKPSKETEKDVEKVEETVQTLNIINHFASLHVKEI